MGRVMVFGFYLWLTVGLVFVLVLESGPMVLQGRDIHLMLSGVREKGSEKVVLYNRLMGKSRVRWRGSVLSMTVAEDYDDSI